jgi:hypothetical protein
VTVADAPFGPLGGTLESLGSRTLTLRTEERTEVIPTESIRRLEVSTGRSPSRTWAGVGVLVGGSTGAFVGGCLANKDDYGVLCGGQDDTRYVIGGVVGGLAGGILGAWLGRTERWDEVDLERERSARREALDRCAAVRRTDPAGPMPMLDCQ